MAQDEPDTSSRRGFESLAHIMTMDTKLQTHKSMPI